MSPNFVAYSILYQLNMSIGGSVVECSPATRAARVRFPADATFIFLHRMEKA